MTWTTDLESLRYPDGTVWVSREGTRWMWRVTLSTDSGARLEASGYASEQESARADGVRVAEGLRRLV